MRHTAAPTPTTKRHWHSKERRRLEGRLLLSLIFEDPDNKGSREDGMATGVKRSDERLVFCVRTQNTPTTVKRSTLRKAAKTVELDVTGFLHLAAAKWSIR